MKSGVFDEMDAEIGRFKRNVRALGEVVRERNVILNRAPTFRVGLSGAVERVRAKSAIKDALHLI